MHSNNVFMVVAESALLVIPLAASLAVQQWARAAAASAMGDDTPRRAGRLTLNPLVHIDPVGTILLPMGLLALQGGARLGGLPLLGWAKPVPVRMENMTRARSHTAAEVALALAQPGCALGLGVLFALVLRGLAGFAPDQAPLLSFAVQMLALNAGLTVFYLVPIGPLSGATLLRAALPPPMAARYEAFNAQYGQWALLLLIMVGRGLLLPPVRALTMALLALAGVGR